MTSDIDYSNKVVLAPMVRVGLLPFRLTALQYGADLVWTEELVDRRVIGSVRKYNPVTKAIEYWKGDRLTFSTCEEERGRVILQLGTADPDLALQAALTVKEDIAGIDVNCGCPKKFSIQGGMGAALLTNPDKLQKILTNLVQKSGLPVTCKIRLLETEEETLKLVKMIESTGVRALTVHCRTKEQRSSTAANWDAFKAIAATVKSIPVIVNGDVTTRQDIPRIKEITNADSFMIARGAQQNPSAFRHEGLLPLEEVIRTYIKKCIDLNNMHQNTKYVLLTMYNDTKDTRSERYTKLQRAKSMLSICELYGLVDYYNEVQALHEARRKEIEQEMENRKQNQKEQSVDRKGGEQTVDEKADDNVAGKKREAPAAEDSDTQSKKQKAACT